MVKSRLLLVLCGYLVFFSCLQKQENIKHKLLIDSISKEDPEVFSSLFSGVIIFCKINNEGKLGFLTVDRIQDIFNHDNLYKNMGFHKFVEGVINQEIILDDKYVGEYYFIPDSIILSEYYKNSFSNFLATYAHYIDKDEYKVSVRSSMEETMTVIYCLYQHNYYSGFDDYVGVFFSTNIDSILKRTVEKIEIEIK